MTSIAWQTMDTIPSCERVFLLLAKGERGNGEIAVGQVVDPASNPGCYWTWGGTSSGYDVDEYPIAWAPLPIGWEYGLKTFASQS